VKKHTPSTSTTQLAFGQKPRIPWVSKWRSVHLSLPEKASVAVVGGGPAGSFFAIRLMRRARERGKEVEVVIFERKQEVCFYRPAPFSSWEGCNYCAGGLSPRLVEALRNEGLEIPEEVIESRASEIIVHADWKSIPLAVPEGRELLSVFRGSRPRERAMRYVNFDTWLLNLAIEQGARVITAEVVSIRYSGQGNPVVSYRSPDKSEENAAVPDESAIRLSGITTSTESTREFDFAVVASGVNRRPGMDVRSEPLLATLGQMMPRFRPPKVRRAVIVEMTDLNEQLRVIEGELHFIQYGSKELHVEMASVMPKRGWITTAILGKSVDQAEPSSLLKIVEKFLELPHIRRLIPYRSKLVPRCCCNPNMTVGAAKHPFGNRIALTGDLAVARLYKDGLYSAFLTSSALADCVLDCGIDERSLRRKFGKVVRQMEADNRYGRWIFRLSRLMLGHPTLSRVLYLAVIMERMTTPRERHRLAPVLWGVASGDASYRASLVRMLHPSSIWQILTGGVFVTIRDVLTEHIFGLDWTGIPRYMTGVPVERVEETRRALFAVQGLEPPERAPDVESMFSIRIRAGKQAVLRQLGAFGDPERQYLKPRLLKIRRLKGKPNEVGTVIRYDVPLARLHFSVALEKVEPERYLLYRIVEGLGEGGILAFMLDEFRPGVSLLTIYVGFDFPRGRGMGRIGWALARWLFPDFAHHVVWNHSLCQIRRLAELDEG